MKKKYKIPLFVFVILIVLIVFLLASKIFFKKEEVNNVKVVDSIDNFSYTLDERDTKLMKDNYNELKDILRKKEINFEDYAKILAKLFVIDLFTIDNKINKYDVGSVEYVYPSARDNFKTNVEDTLYKTIKNNSNKKRKEKLPIVNTVDVEEVKERKYKIGEDTFESYSVTVNWTYETDLGYDTKAIITLVKSNNMLYVVEYSTGDADE